MLFRRSSPLSLYNQFIEVLPSAFLIGNLCVLFAEEKDITAALDDLRLFALDFFLRMNEFEWWSRQALAI
jgi:hypothetical protein